MARLAFIAVAVAAVLAVAVATNEAGEAYLQANAEKEGWNTTPSGLQYFVEKRGGSSQDPPAPSDRVRVHYRGTLIDGTEFDSSYKRGQPATFGVTQVIKGWTEALQLMRPGDKLKLAIPSQLAYGGRSVGAYIQANDALLFDVELLEVVGRAEL